MKSKSIVQLSNQLPSFCSQSYGKLFFSHFSLAVGIHCVLPKPCIVISRLKGLVHDNAHARRFSLQNKFVGSTLNSKLPLPVQSLKILRFIRTSVALAGLVILR